MKAIVVLAAGSKTDEAVLAIALAAARPLGAHLEFLHICVSPGETALLVPHVDFAQGAATRAAMRHLEVEQAFGPGATSFQGTPIPWIASFNAPATVILSFWGVPPRPDACGIRTQQGAGADFFDGRT